MIKNAAENKVPEACFDLAICYETGEGVTRNEIKAFEYYLKAALLDVKQGFYEVGRCYYYGIGIKKDKKIGNIWLDKAKLLGIEK